jgi:hypothetical protein
MDLYSARLCGIKVIIRKDESQQVADGRNRKRSASRGRRKAKPLDPKISGLASSIERALASRRF